MKLLELMKNTSGKCQKISIGQQAKKKRPLPATIEDRVGMDAFVLIGLR
ncbi:MAG: hypothetical protein JAY90_16930 [Candidatus Thiodiazotropha lotti]|nr:hypothetical protein [Candidatus Thiodiazotropha lotti]